MFKKLINTTPAWVWLVIWFSAALAAAVYTGIPYDQNLVVQVPFWMFTIPFTGFAVWIVWIIFCGFATGKTHYNEGGH